MTIQEITKKLSARGPGFQDVRKEYAVLAPLVERDGALSLLFEVRAATLRRQPGEICFPGGRVEPGETPAECALRETTEELGLSPEALELLVPLDRVGHQTGSLIHPFLGRVDAAALARAVPNAAEVGELFQVPLDFFLRTEPEVHQYDLIPDTADFPCDRIGFPQGYAWRGGPIDVPIYRWEGRVIWGLTGRIARHLARRLRED